MLVGGKCGVLPYGTDLIRYVIVYVALFFSSAEESKLLAETVHFCVDPVVCEFSKSSFFLVSVKVSKQSGAINLDTHVCK